MTETIELGDADFAFIFKEDGSREIHVPNETEDGRVPFIIGALILSVMMNEQKDKDFLNFIRSKESGYGLKSYHKEEVKQDYGPCGVCGNIIFTGCCCPKCYMKTKE